MFIVSGLFTFYVYLHFQPIGITQIRGNAVLSSEDLLESLDLESQTSFAGFDPLLHSARVGAMPWIEYGRALRKSPNRIEVIVEERKPVAFFKTRDRVFLIDGERNLLDPMPSLKPWNLPVIVNGKIRGGLATGDNLVSANLNKTLELIDLLRVSRAMPLDAVSEIVITNPVNIVLVTMPDNVRVHMGLDHFEEKLRNLAVAMPEIAKQLARIKILDLRYRNKIVIAKK